MKIYSIQEKDELLKRVPKVPSHFNDGRITSAAFKPKSGEDGLSVDILRLTTIENSIKDPAKFLAAIIISEDATKAGCESIHDPVPENYSHALIKGITKQIARKLSEMCKVTDLAQQI